MPNGPKERDRATVHIIGACLDLGAGRRGVDMGASALRLAGLNQSVGELGYKVVDIGNVPAPVPESQHYGKKNAKYLKEITAFSTELHNVVTESAKAGALPLVLGGDHTVAIGSISAMALNARRRETPLGILWIDAHTDMNTPQTSPTGNIHGMPMAILLGKGPRELVDLGAPGAKLDPTRCAFIGLRSVDPQEAELVKTMGVHCTTMRDIDERGLKACVDAALAHIGRDNAALWVSLDMDGCDPRVAPGVGTPVQGGLTYREAHLAMELVADTRQLAGMDIVEINPILDEHNSTSRFALGLVLSALGKKIL